MAEFMHRGLAAIFRVGQGAGFRPELDQIDDLFQDLLGDALQLFALGRLRIDDYLRDPYRLSSSFTLSFIGRTTE